MDLIVARRGNACKIFNVVGDARFGEAGDTTLVDFDADINERHRTTSSRDPLADMESSWYCHPLIELKQQLANSESNYSIGMFCAERISYV